MALILTSSAFAPRGEIPRAHTCDGAETAPSLTWTGAPPGTRAFALIVDDPDAPDPAAPKRVWVHWVVWDLPASATGIPEGGALPAGAREGSNDGGEIGWQGPCTPVGRHRYVFTLHALDAELGPLEPPTKAALLRAMEGHVLETAQLIGTYARD